MYISESTGGEKTSPDCNLPAASKATGKADDNGSSSSGCHASRMLTLVSTPQDASQGSDLTAPSCRNPANKLRSVLGRESTDGDSEYPVADGKLR